MFDDPLRGRGTAGVVEHVAGQRHHVDGVGQKRLRRARHPGRDLVDRRSRPQPGPHVLLVQSLGEPVRQFISHVSLPAGTS
ncbi:hypothetical protein H7H51_24925 [Mycolicibacterium farcinogenes]|nr:hypothetical protein [Mycolicibacterium farcinogenes]